MFFKKKSKPSISPTPVVSPVFTGTVVIPPQSSIMNNCTFNQSTTGLVYYGATGATMSYPTISPTGPTGSPGPTGSMVQLNPEEIIKSLQENDTTSSYFFYTPDEFVKSMQFFDKFFDYNFSFMYLFQHYYDYICKKMNCEFRFHTDATVQLKDVADWLESAQPTGFIGFNPFTNEVFSSSEETHVLMKMKF